MTLGLASSSEWSENTRNFAENSLAGRQGFEPRYRGPEPRVLPLDDLPVAVDATEERNPNYIRSQFRPARADQALPAPRRTPACNRSCVRSRPMSASVSNRPGLTVVPVVATR